MEIFRNATEGGYIWDEDAWLGWSDTRSCGSSTQHREHPPCAQTLLQIPSLATALQAKPSRKNIHKSSAPADAFVGGQWQPEPSTSLK